MVLSMSKKGPENRGSAGYDNDSEGSESEVACGFSLSEVDGDEDVDTVEVIEKPEANQREQQFIKEAIGFSGNSDAKWFDAKGQSGPSPADFGEHKPIPVDSVCASIVISEEE